MHHGKLHRFKNGYPSLTDLPKMRRFKKLSRAPSAKFDNGVLHIHLPKPAEVAKKQQKIEIKKA